MLQKLYCPIDYGFAWTDDNWYTWDRLSACLAAKTARDAEAKRLKALGRSVRKFTLPNQLVTKGGMNEGRPEIDEVVTVYGLNAA